jgi:hypothetical protein
MQNLGSRLVTDELARHRVQFEHLLPFARAAELTPTILGSHWGVKGYIAHLCTMTRSSRPGSGQPSA